MTEACVTWHHFSDLHMPSRAADRESPMLAALWTDLRREMDEGHRPDLVFCTGDTALTGRAEEFSRAQEVFFDRLAETLRLSPDRIVVVPGNHDCDWDVSRAVTMPVSRERLASGVALRSYWRPLAAYRAFASRFEEPASAAHHRTRLRAPLRHPRDDGVGALHEFGVAIGAVERKAIFREAIQTWACWRLAGPNWLPRWPVCPATS